jgi:hypothetical protein
MCPAARVHPVCPPRGLAFTPQLTCPAAWVHTVCLLCELAFAPRGSTNVSCRAGTLWASIAWIGLCPSHMSPTAQVRFWHPPRGPALILETPILPRGYAANVIFYCSESVFNHVIYIYLVMVLICHLIHVSITTVKCVRVLT